MNEKIITKESLSDLIKKDWSVRKIAEFFGKSRSTINYYLDKYNLYTKTQLKWNKDQNITKEERKKRRVKAVTKRRRKLKQLAINYLGGKCGVCGYDKCNAAMDFHHIDPEKKEFGIAGKGLTRSWERLKKELDKCILLCNRCHAELHHCNLECENC